MPSYYFGGINASGKTAMLDSLRSVDNENEWEIVSGSAELMKYLGITEGDYQTLNRLPFADKNKAYGDFVTDKLDNSSGKSIIFNSHYLNIIRGIIYKTVEGDWISRMDALVLIESDASLIQQRIINDETRQRDIFPPGDLTNTEMTNLIRKYLLETRNEFGRLALKYSLPSICLDNSRDMFDVPITQFLEFNKKVKTISKLKTKKTKI